MSVRQRPTGNASALAWALAAILVLAPGLVWPLGALAWRALSVDGAPSVDVLRQLGGDPFYPARLAVTLGQAILSTVLSLVLGLPAAYVLIRVRVPGRSVIRLLLTVPFVLPSVVLALGFQQLLATDGWLNLALRAAGVPDARLAGTLWPILLAHVCFGAALVIRIVGGAWAVLDPRLEEAARLLGANRRRTFFAVKMPVLRPAIGAAAALVFGFTFTSFGVVLLLGAPASETLGVTVYQFAVRLAEVPVAAALSLVQVVVMAVAVTVYGRSQRRLSARRGTSRLFGTSRPARASWRQALLTAWVLLTLGPLVILPLAALVAGAVSGGHVAGLLDDPAALEAVRNSLVLAGVAVAVTLPLAGAAAIAIARAGQRTGVLMEALLTLPLAVPAVVLGFGMLTTFDRDGYDLRGSLLIVGAAHALVAWPFVVRTVLPAVRAMDPALAEAAATLGATRPRAWRRVDLPLLRPTLLVAAGLAFIASLGELGATLLLRRREFATLPVAVTEALGQPGADALGRALALAALLMGVTVVAFVIIERFRYRDVGEF